jgi:hypothetical protein
MLQSQSLGDIDGIPGILIVVDEFPIEQVKNNF